MASSLNACLSYVIDIYQNMTSEKAFFELMYGVQEEDLKIEPKKDDEHEIWKIY